MVGVKQFLLLSSLVILGCAHHRDVRPSESGVHLVVTQAEEQRQAFQDAKEQAEDYCETLKKKPFVVSEKTTFIGDGDEKSYKRNKGLAKAAKVGGSVGSIFMPSKGARAASGVAVVGGSAGDAYLGEGYRVSVKFKCK